MTLPRLLALALCAVSCAANADEAALARSLAATCANCHGTASRDIPSIAGLPKDKIVAEMQAFRSGARPATVMHQLARGYTDAQIERIAAYFASRKD